MTYKQFVAHMRYIGYYGPVGGYCQPRPDCIGNMVTDPKEIVYALNDNCRSFVIKHSITDPRTDGPLHTFINPIKLMNLSFERVMRMMSRGELYHYHSKERQKKYEKDL